MPLQNRVQPDGEIVATSDRGFYMGNRGGRIHDVATRELDPKRRWASNQWITCALEFKDRQRAVMGDGYTELFFADEVTALAAGHRPCFECRREDAKAFAAAWAKAHGLEKPPKVKEIDTALHKERLDGKEKLAETVLWGKLPDGCIASHNGIFVAKFQGRAFMWSGEGYSRPMEVLFPIKNTKVECLTPASIRAVLKAGYLPKWHPSALNV